MEQDSEYSGVPVDPYNPFSYSSSYYDNRVGLAKELDPKTSISEVIDGFRGIIRDPNDPKKQYSFKRVMNEDGIAVFITQVRAAANSINTFSNYRTDDKLIYRMMQKWITDLVYIFYYERKKFVWEGKEKCLIADEAVVSLVINQAVGLMLASFFKALGAGDRSAVTRSVSEQISRATRDLQSTDDSTPNKKKGLLSRITPFGR